MPRTEVRLLLCLARELLDDPCCSGPGLIHSLSFRGAYFVSNAVHACLRFHLPGVNAWMGLHGERMAGFARVAAPHMWLATTGCRKLFSIYIFISASVHI
jgi:hypothetical protein